MGEEIINLDVMRPDKQIIVIAGKEIDTSLISFGIMVELVGKLESVDDAKTDTKHMFEIFGETMTKILKEADSTIDDKWIKKHIGGFQMLTLINKVVTPLMSNIADTTTGSKKKRRLI